MVLGATMSRAQAGIVWVQRELAVARFRGPRVEEWRAPGPVADAAALREALAEAVRALGLARRTRTFIAYESNALSHFPLMAPPVRERELRLFLARQAEHLKPFAEPATWAYSKGRRSEKGLQIVLHLMPLAEVQAIVECCEALGLYPESLLPISGAMTLRLAELCAGRDARMGMLVALFPSHTEIVVADAAGALLFVRDLGYGPQGEEERLVEEMRRSVLFARQRHGSEPERFWIAGTHSAALLSHLPAALGKRAQVLDEDPVHWTHAQWRDQARTSSNLLPLSLRNRRRTLALARATGAAAALLALGAGATVWTVERLVAAERAAAADVMHEIATLERTRAALLEHQRHAQRQLADAQRLRAQMQPALAPLWIARLATGALPAHMRLARLSVEAGAQGWRLRLVGEVPRALEAPRLLPPLKRALAAPPLAAQVELPWETPWLRALGEGKAEQPLSFRLEAHAP